MTDVSDLMSDATEAIRSGPMVACAKAGRLLEWVRHAKQQQPEREDEIRLVAHHARWQCCQCDLSRQIEEALR